MKVTWIRISTDLSTHPKSILLGVELGESRAHSYMSDLWAWCAQYAQDGFISALMAHVAERSAGWLGTPGVLLKAAEKVRFLDVDTGNPGWRCHDWNEHQGAAIEKAKRDAERKRQAYEAAKEKSRGRQDLARRRRGERTEKVRQSNGTARVRDGTGRDLTGPDVLPSVVGQPPPQVPLDYQAPTKPEGEWDGRDFFAWAQSRRIASGLLGEKLPNLDRLNAWWREVVLAKVSPQRLKEAFYVFGRDPYWEREEVKPPHPWNAFQAKWRDFVSQQEAA